MRMEEAIKWLKNESGIFSPSIDYEKSYKEIIELLEEGKKYKEMWEEHKEGIIYLSRDAFYKGAKILMERIEQKYFPTIDPKPKKELVEIVKKIDKEMRELLKMCGG